MADRADLPQRTLNTPLRADETLRFLGAVLVGLAVLALLMAGLGDDGSALLLAPFGLAGILLTRSPEWALLAVVLAIPVDTELLLPIAGGLSLSKLLGTLLLATLAYDITVRGHRIRLFDDPLDYVIVGFAALVLVSCIAGRHADLPPALRLLRMIGFYFCIKNLIRSSDTLQRVLWAFVLAGWATAIYSMWRFIEARMYHLEDIRVGGVAMHPNDYATQMLVVALFAFHLIFQKRSSRSWTPAVAILVCVASAYAIVLTGSRAGIMILFGSGLIAILRQPARWRILPVAIAISAVSWTIWPRSVTDRMTATFDATPDSRQAESARFSSNRRATYVPLALDLVAERPLLGHGYHAFRQLYAASEYVHRANPLTNTDRDRVAHNTYLEIAVGAGLPAMLAFVSIIGIAWLRVRRARDGSGDLIDCAAAALDIALIGIAFSMLFKSIPAFKLLWFLLGASSAVCSLAARRVKHAAAEGRTN